MLEEFGGEYLRFTDTFRLRVLADVHAAGDWRRHWPLLGYGVQPVPDSDSDAVDAFARVFRLINPA